MAATKAPKIPRLVKDIERDLAREQEPTKNERELGLDNNRLARVIALKRELVESKSFWDAHEAAERAKTRAEELAELRKIVGEGTRAGTLVSKLLAS